MNLSHREPSSPEVTASSTSSTQEQRDGEPCSGGAMTGAATWEDDGAEKGWVDAGAGVATGGYGQGGRPGPEWPPAVGGGGT